MKKKFVVEVEYDGDEKSQQQVIESLVSHTNQILPNNTYLLGTHNQKPFNPLD